MTKKVWVMVDCVATHLTRYCVEVPADHPEYALDTVSSNDAKEFSQQYLGETIVSNRVVTEVEALDMCNKDNDYCHTWDNERKIHAFFTKDGEKVDL